MSIIRRVRLVNYAVWMLTNHDKFKKHIQLLLMGPKSNVQEYSLNLYINTHIKGEIEVIYEWLFIGGEGEE